MQRVLRHIRHGRIALVLARRAVFQVVIWQQGVNVNGELADAARAGRHIDIIAGDVAKGVVIRHGWRAAAHRQTAAEIGVQDVVADVGISGGRIDTAAIDRGYVIDEGVVPDTAVTILVVQPAAFVRAVVIDKVVAHIHCAARAAGQIHRAAVGRRRIAMQLVTIQRKRAVIVVDRAAIKSRIPGKFCLLDNRKRIVVQPAAGSRRVVFQAGCAQR